MSEIDKLREALIDAEAEVTQLKQWVHDLQAGMYINCVYCGHRYGPDDEIPATMADVLKEHIAQCPKHPMSQLQRTTIDVICWCISRVRDEAEDGDYATAADDVTNKLFFLADWIRENYVRQLPSDGKSGVPNGYP